MFQDLEDLKKEVEVAEDVHELIESKSSARLGKRVTRMVGRLEKIVSELEEEKKSLVQEKEDLKDDLAVRKEEEMEMNTEAEQKMESQIDGKK